jgi:L-seryl-tRNA(Ser) seleniumtransferase
MDPKTRELLRSLPKVDVLLADARCTDLIEAYGRGPVAEAVREALEALRQTILAGTDTIDIGTDILLDTVDAVLEEGAQPSLCGVINGTGIVLHTNLGRAPLGLEVMDALIEAALEYTNLEYDLEAGRRGSRQAHVDTLLAQLTGAEAALVVNNNAAAVVLAVNTLARGGEVVTSRGELIEIGGSFRIPDVIETSEARLVETGTTNRTRAADYAQAITPKTRMLLKVHPSNYRIVGFTEAPGREELVALARERGLVSMEDLGSGTLVNLAALGLASEPTVQEALHAGMDIVTFSGDKLLGGPQAGVVCGRADLINRMKQNPLYRALRIGKLPLAALEATLRLYLDEATAFDRVPVLMMLRLSSAELRKRARQLAKRLNKIPGVTTEPVETTGFAGGGSLPEVGLPDWAVAVRVEGMLADDLHAELRVGYPPVIGRISEGVVLLHLRTVKVEHFEAIEAAFTQIVS